MGIVVNISHNTFPKQSPDLGRRILVCFNYDLSRQLEGVIVRDDMEEPGRMIIKLDDERYVLSTECQWTYKR